MELETLIIRVLRRIEDPAVTVSGMLEVIGTDQRIPFRNFEELVLLLETFLMKTENTNSLRITSTGIE